MKIKITNRQSLSAIVIIFYLIPIFFFSTYSIQLMSYHKSWILLSFGLVMVMFGALILILLLSYWEQSLRDRKLTYSSQLTYSSSEKEAKVTLLDPKLTFNSNSLPIYDSLDLTVGSKEHSKEVNLIQTGLKETQEQHEQLMKVLELTQQDLQRYEEENKQLQLKAQQVAQDFGDYKLFSEEQLKQKHLQLATLQQIVEDQRTEMEKRQEQIYQLDTKVHDLSYEIKTLLYLHDEEKSCSKSSPAKKEGISRLPLNELQTEESLSKVVIESIQTESASNENSLIRYSAEATHLLKKCINTAQKLAGANYHNNESSRYREFSSSYYAIDQRRLFDSLRNETRALIIVHSPKENKILFANSLSKILLGWSVEKFVADFPMIMQEGFQEWKKTLQLLATMPETQLRLLAKTKQGQELLLNCHLGTIPTGLFRNYVIGIFYPA